MLLCILYCTYHKFVCKINPEIAKFMVKWQTTDSRQFRAKSGQIALGYLTKNQIALSAKVDGVCCVPLRRIHDFKLSPSVVGANPTG